MTLGAEPAPSLRPATAADIPFLIDLRRQAMGPHHDSAGITQDESEMAVRVNAQFDGASIVELAGQRIGLLKVLRGRDAWRLLQIQLLPGHQGRGIGTSLISALQREAQAAGVTLTLAVLKANPALHLYERLGFRTTGEDDLSLEMRDRPVSSNEPDAGAADAQNVPG